MEELDRARAEIIHLKDEVHRLTNTVSNKDNQNQMLQQAIDKEKDRREGETTELRRLFDKEQDRAIFAIREAEKNLTKVDNYQHLADKAENEVQAKERFITGL